MGTVCKATRWRLKAFIGTISTGLLTSGVLLPAILLSSRYALAQVTSDGTTNTIVNSNGNNFTILNGIEKGNNLFHSFGNFSVPTGGSATFDLVNTPNISTIFSRVTGSNASNIDGLIKTINSSNPVSLFLLNPNGILFGKEARLQIGGSFIATTASSIKFADGIEFSARNPAPLLTISVPIGLQMDQNLSSISSQARVLDRGGTVIGGLQVSTNRNIFLVGGTLQLDQSGLYAPGGRIELVSIAGTGAISFKLLPGAVTLMEKSS